GAVHQEQYRKAIVGTGRQPLAIHGKPHIALISHIALAPNTRTGASLGFGGSQAGIETGGKSGAQNSHSSSAEQCASCNVAISHFASSIWSREDMAVIF